MSLAWRDSALRHVGAAYLRTADGLAAGDRKTIDQMRLRVVDGTDPANLIQVYQQGLRLAVAPDSASGFTTSKTGPVNTGYVTVSVAGGTPPYTHLWAADAGINVAFPHAASTFFGGNPPGESGEISGTATDTVTDANGVTNSIGVPVGITRGQF